MSSFRASEDDEVVAAYLMTLKHRTAILDDDEQEETDGMESNRVPAFWKSKNVGSPQTSHRFEQDEQPQQQQQQDEEQEDVPHTSHSLTISQQDHEMAVPLSMPDDVHYLSDAQCLLRSQFCEFFTVTDSSNYNTHNYNTPPHNNPPKRTRRTPKRHPTTPGRVGIRCTFCKHLPPSQRANQSTSFPSRLAGIYGAVGMLECRHFSKCPCVPIDLKNQLVMLKRDAIVASPGRQLYWRESALRLGLVDSEDGIRWKENEGGNKWNTSLPRTPVSSLASRKWSTSHPSSLSTPHDMSSSSSKSSSHWSKHSHRTTPEMTWEDPAKEVVTFNYYDTVEEYQKSRATTSISSNTASSMTLKEEEPRRSVSRGNHSNKTKPANGTTTNKRRTAHALSSSSSSSDRDIATITPLKSIDDYLEPNSLVQPQDKDLVPDYLYLAIAQMKPCKLTDADRVGCYKNRQLNFVGMCCKHCGGQPGFGKFFPATVRSLAQTTTSQTIVKHVSAKCRSCPPEIRRAVLDLQEQQQQQVLNQDKAGDAMEVRPRYGSRKVFFQRVWDRLHGTTEEGSTTASSSSEEQTEASTRAVSPIGTTQPCPKGASESEGDSDIENKVLFQSNIQDNQCSESLRRPLLEQDPKRSNSHFSKSNYNFPLKKRRRVVSLSSEEENSAKILRPVQRQLL